MYLRPTRLTSSLMNKRKMPIGTKLDHLPNGDELIEFNYKNLTFVKMFNSKLFQLNSIIKSIELSNKKKISIGPFMRSYIFYTQLCLLDNELPHFGNVYIKYGEKPKTIKIGRAFDLSRRYDKNKQDEIIRIIPVSNDSATENDLLKAFNNKSDEYSLVDGTKETFTYTNLQHAINLFNEITNKRKIEKLDYSKSKHIKRVRISQNKENIWCSLEVIRIIINNYIQAENIKQDYEQLFKAIESYISKDIYMYVEHNNLLHQNCLYWLFHKYIVIQNDKDLMVNGSRLWNSIIENEKKLGKKKTITTTFRQFLQSEKMQRIHRQFELTYPDEIFYTEPIKNKEQPQFNGIYVHYVLVHFIVEYLDADYALMVAKLMYKRFKLGHSISGGNINEDINEETPDESKYIERYKENLHSMKDLISFKAIMEI